MRVLKISTLFALCLLLNSCERTSRYDYVVDETYVHRYGVAVPQNDWEASGQSGQVIITLKNGVVMTKNTSQGMLEGDTTYTFPHSEVIQKVETYAQNNLQKAMEYYRSGKPAQETIYEGSNSQKITKWYENGAPQSKESFVNGKLVTGDYYTPRNEPEAMVSNAKGTRIQRDIYGQFLSSDTIEDGVMVLSTTVHPNNAPKELIPYNKNGVVEGQLKAFLPKGEPDRVENWVGGLKEGISTLYLEGLKYAEVPYIAGIKHGIEKRYKDGKQLIEEISWSNGQRHGPSYAYIGDIVKPEWHYQDRLVTEKTFELLNRGKPIN